MSEQHIPVSCHTLVKALATHPEPPLHTSQLHVRVLRGLCLGHPCSGFPVELLRGLLLKFFQSHSPFILVLAVRVSVMSREPSYHFFNLQATDIGEDGGFQPAFELVHNTQPWLAPYEDPFAEPENPVPYQGGQTAPSAGFGNNIANGHADVSTRTSCGKHGTFHLMLLSNVLTGQALQRTTRLASNCTDFQIHWLRQHPAVLVRLCPLL